MDTKNAAYNILSEADDSGSLLSMVMNYFTTDELAKFAKSVAEDLDNTETEDYKAVADHCDRH